MEKSTIASSRVPRVWKPSQYEMYNQTTQNSPEECLQHLYKRSLAPKVTCSGRAALTLRFDRVVCVVVIPTARRSVTVSSCDKVGECDINKKLPCKSFENTFSFFIMAGGRVKVHKRGSGVVGASLLFLPSGRALLTICAVLLLVMTIGLQYLASANSAISERAVRREGGKKEGGKSKTGTGASDVDDTHEATAP